MLRIHSIAVLTSGGDSPGMNACIRAVVRTGICHGLKTYGIHRGYEGLIEGDIRELQSLDVSNIIQRGGTILKTARSDRFKTADGMAKAGDNLRRYKIDALVAIGGDGTFRGAKEFSAKYRIPVIGIPGTIDNDLYGTDFTIGYDTAINTAVEAIDKIRDTAASHNRLFFIEVMGRDAGLIALRSGIAGGAEAILVPETRTDVNTLIEKLREGWIHNKTSMIVVVAEGDEIGGAFKVAERVKKEFDYYDIRVTVLGHLQRGGTPTAMDRVLASRLGVAAVEGLLKGKKNVMAGVVHQDIVFVPFSKAVKHHRDINPHLLKIAEILAK
ncbi:MAG: 6-phosphofructokinase [Bacteroidetes bacterium]|nr:6-phosphofructokinase [Bacteroidota bacterium]